MARLYTYGNRLTVTRQNHWLPGRFSTAWGVNLNAPAVKDPALAIEYGEIVALTGGGQGANAYVIGRVAGNSTRFGVILRTTDGQINMEGAWVETPRTHNPLSVYPLGTAPNYFTVAVPLQAGQVPVVGANAFVGVGAGVEGAVRTDATNGVALTGWVFASTAYQPTDSNSLVVLIQKTV